MKMNGEVLQNHSNNNRAGLKHTVNIETVKMVKAQAPQPPLLCVHPCTNLTNECINTCSGISLYVCMSVCRYACCMHACI